MQSQDKKHTCKCFRMIVFIAIDVNDVESSHGTIVPRKFAELGGTKWN